MILTIELHQIKEAKSMILKITYKNFQSTIFDYDNDRFTKLSGPYFYWVEPAEPPLSSTSLHSLKRQSNLKFDSRYCLINADKFDDTIILGYLLDNFSKKLPTPEQMGSIVSDAHTYNNKKQFDEDSNRSGVAP